MKSIRLQVTHVNQWTGKLYPETCPKHDLYFASVRRRNDTLEVRRWCTRCSFQELGWSHKRLLAEHGILPEDLPIERDHLGESPSCEVESCDNAGSELHHWAPRSIFGWEECDMWPTSYLCRTHHQEWHQRTKLATGTDMR